MTSQYVLSIDEGTTGVTALLIDVSSTQWSVARQASVDFPQHFPKSGWVEHDLGDIWAAVRSCIQQCLNETRDPAFKSQKKIDPKSILCIGITNQRETLCVFDRKTGTPSRKAIVWQCKRSDELCIQLRKDGFSEFVRSNTGLVIDPYFTGSKIKWVMKEDSATASMIRSGKSVVGTIDTFLLHRLTGGVSFATEASNASRTLLCDLKGSWNKDLLKMFDVPSESALPEIKPSAGVFGLTKGLDFLPDGIPISGILGDQQAALAAQTCFEVGDSKCTYGTGAFLLTNIGTKPKLSSAGLLTTIAWDLNGQLTYAYEGSAFVAGAAVHFLKDQLGFLPDASTAEQMIASAHASPDLFFVPSLSGLGAPYWDAQAKGAFLGMHRGTTQADLVRACLEGVVLQVMDLADSASIDLGTPLKRLGVDGGASANNFMMQLQADLLSIHVDRPKNIETTAFGAGMFAALGQGLISSLSELKSTRVVDQVFKPSSLKDRASEITHMKNGWKKAVQAVQVFSGRLSI